MKTLTGLILIGFLSFQNVSAEITEEKINSIAKLTNVICNSLQNSGSSSTVTIDAKAAAEAKAILRMLGSVKGSIDADAVISKYKNVPRSDLTDLLKSAQECRLKVFLSVHKEVAAIDLSNQKTTQPAQPEKTTINQSTTGEKSPALLNSGPGSVTINIK